MRLSQRSRFGILLALHALWGLVLWFSISKYGLGVSTDSVHLLFGGLNFWAGRGLISYDGGFLKLWPPLYPVLLAAVHGALGLQMLASAEVLEGGAYLGVSLCLAILFVRIFSRNFLLAVAATLLSDVGAVILISFNTAGSDYLQLFLIMLFVLLMGTYLQTASPRAFAGMAVIGILSTLNRYLGAAVLVTGAMAILLLARGTAWQRLWRSVILGATALPAVTWLAVTSRFYPARPAISFEENFGWFSRSIIGWFVEPTEAKRQINREVPWLWIVILGMVLLLFLWRRQTKEAVGKEREPSGHGSPDDLYLTALLLFGACYVLVLFGSASVVYFNKLGGRFLLPLYVPLVVVPVAAADAVLSRVAETQSKPTRLAVSAACYGALAAMILLLLKVTMPLVIESHSQGAAGGENAFNTRAWRENPAMQYWLSHVPNEPYNLLTNEPDGVAFQAQHTALASPRKTSGPYGTEEYPLGTYAADLFRSGAEVFLVWIEPNPCSYCYGVEELRRIAEVEPLFVSDAGGAYRLRPK